MQIRRVLLLFALVLGLSALVASIAPPPEEDEPEPQPPIAAPAESAEPLLRPAITLRVRNPSPRAVTRRVRAGSSFSVTVLVPKAGDVVLDGLGLRQTADPHTPAHFELLASPPGRHEVAFTPVDGDRRVIARLAFVRGATVKPRRRDHSRSAR